METLGSLLVQPQLAEINLILVADDGSVDGTAELAASALGGHPWKLVRSDTNQGERKNVNQSILTVGGDADWILVMHSDDLAEPTWLLELLERIDKCSDSVASICCSWNTLKANGKIESGENRSDQPFSVIQGGQEAVRDTLGSGCWWHLSGAALRLDALRDVGMFDPVMPQHGDWEWLLRCLSAGWSIEYIPRSLITYRESPVGVSAVSFDTDRDVREAVEILHRYRACVGRWETATFITKLIKFTLRRLMRGVVSASPRRIARSVMTFGYLARTVFGLLVRHPRQ